MKKKIQIFAAHPDDEVLGCGGTILNNIKKGNIVQTVFFTDGVGSRGKKNFTKLSKERQKSALKAAKILKTKKPIFGEFPDNQLDTIPFLKIVQFVEKNINKFKPTEIFTHFSEDLNIDHKLVSQAVITACRPEKKLKVEKIFFFEIPSSTEWKISLKKNKTFNPNWFEDISSNLRKKLKTLNAYKSELRKWPHPRSLKGIKALSEWRGATVGYKAAEAFILARKK